MKTEGGDSPRHFAKAITYHRSTVFNCAASLQFIETLGKLLPKLHCSAWCSKVWNAAFFGHCESAVMAMFSPSLFTGEAEWESEKGLMLSLCFSYWSLLHKNKDCCVNTVQVTSLLVLHMSCYEENYIHPNPMHYNSQEVTTGLGNPDIFDCWKLDAFIFSHSPFSYFLRTCCLLSKKED